MDVFSCHVISAQVSMSCSKSSQRQKNKGLLLLYPPSFLSCPRVDFQTETSSFSILQIQFWIRIIFSEGKPRIPSNYSFQPYAFLFGDNDTQVQLLRWWNENRRRKNTLSLLKQILTIKNMTLPYHVLPRTQPGVMKTLQLVLSSLQPWTSCRWNKMNCHHQHDSLLIQPHPRVGELSNFILL